MNHKNLSILNQAGDTNFLRKPLAEVLSVLIQRYSNRINIEYCEMLNASMQI